MKTNMVWFKEINYAIYSTSIENHLVILIDRNIFNKIQIFSM